MKRIILGILAVSAMLCGCQKNDVSEQVQESATLQATIEDVASTKTVMDANNNILWQEGDQIVAFMKSSYRHKYQLLSSYAGKAYADFEPVSSGNGGNLSAGTEWDHNVAYYPYSETVECLKSGSNYSLSVVLPSEQIYAEESFGNGSMAMVAVSEDNNITFRNVLGGMKLQLKGTQTVTSITLQGKNSEKLSGAATVTAYTDEIKPAITMASDASTSVTLNCGSGVQLNETTATEFIIALPPVLFSQGFTVTITDDAGNEQTIETDKENSVLRSSLLVMPEVTPAVSLTTTGTSNSYIVSQKGTYSFPTVKGNSSASVGSVESAEVLWESFGTDVTPEVGDLVSAVMYDNGNIYFKTADTFKEGNAVIAAKDASGTILWSWHIWLTDQPEEQVYYNNAGTMMDRNLGATSATPGDVGALGLFYQWGRKDPFLGSSSISSKIEAKSTGTWPSAVSSNSTNGTIEYATAYPTTFINYNSSNDDWYYTGSSTTDNTRWTTSATTKSIYDPCPSGWRVPDGGENGIWSKALGSSSSFKDPLLYDSTNEGINFSGKFGSASTIWYPASGDRYYYGGSLDAVGSYGYYWSASPVSAHYGAYVLYFDYNGYVYPSLSSNRAFGQPVRCLQE